MWPTPGPRFCAPTIEAAVESEPVKKYDEQAVTIPAVKRQPAALAKERMGVSVTSSSSGDCCCDSIEADDSAARHAEGGSSRVSGSAAGTKRPAGANRGIGARSVRRGDRTMALAVAASASTARRAAGGMAANELSGPMKWIGEASARPATSPSVLYKASPSAFTPSVEACSTPNRLRPTHDHSTQATQGPCTHTASSGRENC